ncbi:hypothetical protein HYN48_06620 [Flavobacterium magnum]|uniref:Glycosyltransferase subfamily 4-like N-terminal domain-containing protein n=1 Tax=Flavobacterium magnum TaxID=2162713 RepID=A0A2S0RDM1_9FLAO|nr:hypothetical protein [Flavobacterium magnum]AWA29776.1 hypothetical protein HYN48_06620 [Flavobacterium magnum]
MKKILILANYLPSGGWGGGVIMRSLTQNPPENVSFLWTVPTSAALPSPWFGSMRLLGFRAGFFRGRGFSTAILHLESILFSLRFRKFLKQNAVDTLWIVMPTAFQDIYRLSVLCRGANIRIHVSVHDDPVLENEKRHKLVDRLFRGILDKSHSIDVISARMQRRYKQQYGVDSTVITRTVPDNFPGNVQAPDHCLNILMGGYGNASAPWPQPLIDAVAQLNTVCGTTLMLFDPKLRPWESDRVKVFDLMDEMQFNALLQTVHLGYACDDLSPDKIAFAQLSLPTKVITYIGAGIPFVYHGPADSTVGDLLKEFKAGVIVSSNDVGELYEAFMELKSNYSLYAHQCALAVEECFSEAKVLGRLYRELLK